MAKWDINKEFYYKLSQENELMNAEELTGAQIAKSTNVSVDLLKLIKCSSFDVGEDVSFNDILNKSFECFTIFNNNQLFDELGLLSNVDCVYENGNYEFDKFSVRSKLVLLSTGAYTVPQQLLVPCNIKKASAYYLSHDMCHMLKERNPQECALKNGYLEVIPMLVEFIFSYSKDNESFKVILNNRVKRLKNNANDYMRLYDCYVSAKTYEEKKLYLTALSELGKYLHSFYYTLVLFKIYLSDNQYFADSGKSNKKYILDLISKVLLCKMTTKDMIDDIEMYITNIDTVYENAIDTVNDMVVGI